MIDSQILKIFAVALICVAVGAVIKLVRGEMAFAVRIAGMLLVFGMLTVSAETLLRDLSAVFDTGGFSEYVELILKALGVAVLTHVAASICRDCGEGGLAGAVEFAGKAEILLLSLPMIEKLLKYTAQIASLGAG